jgi:hypothetical protein
MIDKRANHPESANKTNRSDQDPRPFVAPDATTARLRSELSDLEAAIELVGSGAADRITLSGLRFGEQLLARFASAAAEAGLVLEPIMWPADEGANIMVRRTKETHNG